MMAMTGESLDYHIEVRTYAAPGLYWYYTHSHGASARLDLDGMSDAIVVDEIDKYYREPRHMRERVFVLRDRDLEKEKAEVRRSCSRLAFPPAIAERLKNRTRPDAKGAGGVVAALANCQ
jgi:hypothetical protein